MTGATDGQAGGEEQAIYTEADLGLVLRAAAYAAEKHRTQKRKDREQTPYITHPIGVAQTLWTVGGVRSSRVLAAALLHDTIEDTTATPDEVEKCFGPEVLALVLEVTDDKSLPKQERKELQVETAPHKSDEAKLIKLSDKIHNVHDVGFTPPADWPRERVAEYLTWAQRVVEGLRGVNAPLEAAFDAALEEATTRLARS